MDTGSGTGILTRSIWGGILAGIVIAACFSGLSVQAEDGKKTVSKVETLERDVALLKTQIRQLTEALAEARAEADALKRRKAAAEGAVSTIDSGLEELMKSGRLRVLDVNPELRMVVMNAGLWRHVRPGMVFTVRREERTIARVVVIDVREQISGALVKGDLENGFPQKGDLVMISENR